MNTFLRSRAVSERTGLGRSTIYKRVQEGTFPPPIKIGERASAWLESDIAEWQKQCIEASRTGKAA